VSAGVAAHGDRRRYQLGCRCPTCTLSNTGYQREVRAGRRGTPGDRFGGYAVDLGAALFDEDDGG
jgi:hypothetical protein